MKERSFHYTLLGFIIIIITTAFMRIVLKSLEKIIMAKINAPILSSNPSC